MEGSAHNIQKHMPMKSAPNEPSSDGSCMGIGMPCVGGPVLVELALKSMGKDLLNANIICPCVLPYLSSQKKGSASQCSLNPETLLPRKTTVAISAM